MSHKLFYTVSVLPALLIMPAMADVVDLNDQYPDGGINERLTADGTSLSLTTDNIKFDTTEITLAVAENGGTLVLGGDATQSIAINAVPGQTMAVRTMATGGTIELNAKDINVSAGSIGLRNDAGIVKATGESISISGNFGIYGNSTVEGTETILKGTDITINDGKYAVVASGTKVDVTGKTINMSGSESVLQVQENGEMTVTANDGGTINIKDGKYGVVAIGSKVDVTGKNINIFDNEKALLVRDSGKMTVTANDAGTVDIKGSKYAAAANSRGTVDITANDGGTINLAAQDTADLYAYSGGTVNVTGDNINIGGGTAKRAIFVQNDDGEANAGGHINVKGNNVKIVNNDILWGAVFAQSKPESSDLASIAIDAKNIDITAGRNALVAMAYGVINVNGNTVINAKNAVVARGDAQVRVNESGEYTTKMNGDIVFAYDHATSGTAIDALVDVTFAGADSVWNGNTAITWDEKPEDLTKLEVDQATITLKDGATWNATKIIDDSIDEAGYTYAYTALNNLNIDNGTVNIADDARGIDVENANVTNGKFTGGHLHITDTATIADSEFNGHHTLAAGVKGGAIFNDIPATVNLTNSVFTDNKSDVYAGAIHNSGVMSISNSTFDGNNSQAGGAIYSGTKSDITITDSVFSGNFANDFGAVGIFKKGKVSGTKFANNRTTSSAEDADGAGALFLGSESTTDVDDVLFYNNRSAAAGGALATRYSTLKTTQSKTIILRPHWI